MIIKKFDNIELATEWCISNKLKVYIGLTNSYDGYSIHLNNTTRKHPVYVNNLKIGYITELIHPNSVLIEIDKKLFKSHLNHI